MLLFIKIVLDLSDVEIDSIVVLLINSKMDGVIVINMIFLCDVVVGL